MPLTAEARHLRNCGTAQAGYIRALSFKAISRKASGANKIRVAEHLFELQQHADPGLIKLKLSKFGGHLWIMSDYALPDISWLLAHN